ncbi:MAG: amino acid permease [Armatimonadetes bacterium]|nr:amino acid permease [Armatimonadota bacterium]
MPDQLPRRLNLVDAIAIVVGSMIGSGIFLKASEIAHLLPDPAIVVAVWVAAGALTLCGGLVMAELGAMYPHSGGLYVYLREAYGSFFAFVFGWSLLAILQTGSIAGMAAGAAQSLTVLWPEIEPVRTLLAAGLIVLLTLVNIASLKAGARVQNLLTSAKVLGILLLVGGAVAMGHTDTANFAPEGVQPAGAALIGAFGLCMIKALWAYDGWVNLSFVGGELREPQRNLPRAVGLGVVVVIMVYLATNVVYHLALPVSAVQASSSVAVEVAREMMGATGALALTILTFVSMAGALNSSILSAPRVYYAMALDRLFFPIVAAVHPRFATPYVALALQGAWSLALLVWWQNFSRITDNVIFIFWIFYALGALAVIILRHKRPDRERPYRAVGYPWLPVAFVAAALWLTLNNIWLDPANSAQALVLVASGALLYPLFRKGAGADSPAAVGRDNGGTR